MRIMYWLLMLACAVSSLMAVIELSYWWTIGQGNMVALTMFTLMAAVAGFLAWWMHSLLYYPENDDPMIVESDPFRDDHTI